MNSPILPALFREMLLKSIEVMTMGMSQSHYMDEFFARMSLDELLTLVSKTPTWFSQYDLPFDQMARATIKESKVPGMLSGYEQIMQKPDPLQAFYIEGKAMMGENVDELLEALRSPSPPILNHALSDEEQEQVGDALASLRAATCAMRALAFYGQPINDLLNAGRNGIDEGFLKAAAIDPTIQAHPDVAGRLARSLLNPHDDFADRLRDAAAKGPSLNIDKDHHQLRMALCFLRGSGLLQQWTEEQRYQVFCVELEFYSTKGKDPKAALNAFVRRWEKSLV